MTPARPAGAPEPLRWVLLAPGEVGLLHRLRPVVRAAAGTVLVRLDPGAAPPGAQVGVVDARPLPGAGTAAWFGGLSAADAGVLLRWLGGPAGPPPRALEHRLLRPAPAERG